MDRSSESAAAAASASAVYAPRRRFARTGRVRSGCLTCKARKKKCDERYAADGNRCQTCARLKLVCERLPLRTVEPKQKHHSRPYHQVSHSPTASLSSPASLNLYEKDDQQETETLDLVCKPHRARHFMVLFSLDNASPERILLKYYVERLASLCTILQEGNNEFRNVLLPMAMDDPSLLYALFAYASIHLPTSSPVPPLLHLSRLKFESKAARGLSDAIRRNDISASSVACALICSTAEVVSGSTDRWYIHLQGAGHLIAKQGGPARFRQTSDGLILLRNFAYHDILAVVSTSGRPQIRGVYWAGDGTISADCLMGLTHDILGHISEICLLIADANDCEFSTAQDPAEFISRGEEIAQCLHTQRLNLCTARSNTELGILMHHAEAFRYAGLLHLYRFLSRFSVDIYRPKITQCAESIIAHVTQVPLGVHCVYSFLSSWRASPGSTRRRTAIFALALIISSAGLSLCISSGSESCSSLFGPHQERIGNSYCRNAAGGSRLLDKNRSYQTVGPFVCCVFYISLVIFNLIGILRLQQY